MISHRNLIAALKASLDVTAMAGEVQADDTYAAYLPLAHIMEMMCESMTFIQGIPIGYSSPLTLTDKSPGVKEGCVGDVSLIKPSVLPAVPVSVTCYILEILLCSMFFLKLNNSDFNSSSLWNAFVKGSKRKCPPKDPSRKSYSTFSWIIKSVGRDWDTGRHWWIKFSLVKSHPLWEGG